MGFAVFCARSVTVTLTERETLKKLTAARACTCHVPTRSSIDQHLNCNQPFCLSLSKQQTQAQLINLFNPSVLLLCFSAQTHGHLTIAQLITCKAAPHATTAAAEARPRRWASSWRAHTQQQRHQPSASWQQRQQQQQQQASRLCSKDPQRQLRGSQVQVLQQGCRSSAPCKGVCQHITRPVAHLLELLQPLCPLNMRCFAVPVAACCSGGLASW